MYTHVYIYQPLKKKKRKEDMNLEESKQEYIEGFKGRKRKGERVQLQSQKQNNILKMNEGG